MMRRPLVMFAVCWVLGSCAAAGLASRGVMLAGGALAAAMLALWIRRRVSWPLAAACLVAFSLAAGERMWVDAHNASSLPALFAAAGAAVPGDFAADLEAELTGTIISAVEIDGDRVQFRVTASSVRVKGEQAPLAFSERLLVQVRLAAQPELAVAANWRRGDRIRLAGEFAQPAEATNFGGFDYRRYLKSQRIHWLFKASGAATVHTSAGPRWSTASLLSRIDTMRAALGSRMDALYPGEQSGYMKGLVLGISEDLDPERFRQFAQLGLTHILAISGLHVAVFLYVLGGLLRLLRMTRERMLLLMIAAVPFYVLLAGCLSVGHPRRNYGYAWPRGGAHAQTEGRPAFTQCRCLINAGMGSLYAEQCRISAFISGYRWTYSWRTACAGVASKRFPDQSIV